MIIVIWGRLERLSLVQVLDKERTKETLSQQAYALASRVFCFAYLLGLCLCALMCTFVTFFKKEKKHYIYIYIRKDIKPSFCLASRVFCFTYLLGICLCTHLWFFFQNKKHYIYKRNDIKPSLCLASRDCASYIFRHLSLCAILHVCEFFSKKINNKTHTHTHILNQNVYIIISQWKYNINQKQKLHELPINNYQSIRNQHIICNQLSYINLLGIKISMNFNLYSKAIPLFREMSI